MHLLDNLVVELSVCWLSACHVTNLNCLLEKSLHHYISSAGLSRYND